jgi:hypothetical protein
LRGELIFFRLTCLCIFLLSWFFSQM